VAETVCIPLNQGKRAVIDADDLPRIVPYHWFAYHVRQGDRWLAARTERSGDGKHAPVRTIWMHRVILDAPTGVDVTHLNGDGLDNRKRNLRTVTVVEKGARGRLRRTNTSGYRGVSRHAQSGKWRAMLQHRGAKLHLGVFATREEAARAYDAKALALYGELAILNFPAHREGE